MMQANGNTPSGQSPQLRKLRKKRKKHVSTSLRTEVAPLSPEQDQLPPFLKINADCLEHIASFLDARSCINLLLTCKDVNTRLNNSPGFWRDVCRHENFNEYTALKLEEESDRPRRTYSGEKFHDVDVPETAPLWRKIYLRGMQMRRNICLGRFELWRLFLTDEDSLPVMKMTKKTSERSLRSPHRNSRFNKPHRRVRINRYWNEEYFVAIQHKFDVNGFNDIFVWGWKECQKPKFLYTYDLSPHYPTGLFPTSFFLWKKYFVLMPETGFVSEDRELRSMIRVHDLSNNMKLIGSYDFPQESQLRRHIRFNPASNEAAHLHKVQDKAVALCRTPKLMIFIFSLPECQLLKEVQLSFSGIQRPLEQDDLDQRFQMRDNTMMFIFHDPEFFTHMFQWDDDHPVPFTRRFGQLLLVDFDKFLSHGGDLEMRLDPHFDSNDDYIERVSVIHKDKLACALTSGKIVIRDLVATSDSTVSFVDRLTIPCPEDLKEEFDSDIGDEVDTDGPVLATSRNGDMAVIMRHFESGRKIHAYNIQAEGGGSLLYTINLDCPNINLERNPGYVSVDMDGNFLCAADMEKIVVWNSRTGQLVRSIPIPKHYNVREDVLEQMDKFCWKGHTDFAFAEDGIIIVHSQRNFPVAADVMLFW